MPRIVPSQVVIVIDSLFPGAANETENTPLRLTWDHSTPLLAVIELTDRIPEELLVLEPTKYAEYLASVAAIRWITGRWQTTERTSLSYSRELLPIPGLRRHSPIALIRQALALCPDEFPATGTSQLSFVTDPALRESLRLDISATNSAITNGEWKAATVLAGSVVEALLLWALLQQNQVNVIAALASLGLKASSNLEDWVLDQYIKVAAELKLIAAETATQCMIAKGFRNLIHPGRAQRLEQVCNRGTALSAVAAVEHVITDLSH